MKLTNKQLRQIIKEELEAVLDEGFGDNLSDTDRGVIKAMTKMGEKVPYSDLSSMGDMGEQRHFINLRDEENSYLLIVGSSAGERTGSLYVNIDGQVYLMSNSRPMAEIENAIEGLRNYGFSGRTIERPKGRYFGPANKNTNYTGY